jgi:hypothetical protein
MENPLPSREALKQTLSTVANFIGRAVTLRAFLPEEPFASHGDHEPSSVDEMLLQEPGAPYTYPQQGFNEFGDYTCI